ncbi:Phospholipase A I [Hypsizygus marmoreus]|uniref:Phospholipase A I n=1 Tax=Hypsizygus marmoreus TaxID=39966 RepID=A0A369JEL7_HYPMA|nr:Phospholipase A I [Hypsizygus marmoreus]
MAPIQLSNQHKRILVIDGGGFRGLGSLIVIDSIMKTVASRSRKPLLPCEVFDLICGTSTGGLIAILLGRLGLDCATAIQIYKDLAISVCGTEERAFWEKLLRSIDGSLEAKSYEDALAEVIQKYTGVTDTAMVTLKSGGEVVGHGTTNTFVTVTSDAPTYNNRIHCIRSYPSTVRPPPPSGHQWLIREAARGTVASRVFMSPLFVSKYGYRDAGFAGFNNPVALVPNEIQELYPNDQISVIVSIGSGLTGFTPPHPRREWAVTDQFAAAFVDKIMSKLPSSMGDQDTLRRNALFLVKQFVTLSVDTEITQIQMAQKFSSKGTYVRLNPPLGIPEIDLADCFRTDEVESTVRAWLHSEGKASIADIAVGLVDLNTQPIKIDEASLIVPPSPPPDTVNPGYNPQLDERRPDNMMDYLRNYHVFFVIDDSGSMEGDRWSEARDALLEIADHALKQNVEEIDLMFFNDTTVYRGVKGAGAIEAIFMAVKPDGLTPTGATLQRVLNEHITTLDRAVGGPGYHAVRPLDIIVLTDGVPTDDPKTVLVDAVARMKTSKHHPNAVGVQIVQIGDESDAVPVLKSLMHGDVGNIVDTVPYNGRLTPQKLERILLGGLHPNIRAMIAV